MSRLRRAVAVVALVAACKAKRDLEHEARPVEAVKDAGARDAVTAASTWTQLGALPIVHPVWTVMLPSRPDQPRFDVVGPVIVGDVAVVGSSQLGFAGVNWRRGAVEWTKPAGSRLAPPVVHGEDVLLIGDCLGAPQIPDREQLLGCLRTVTATGAERAYIAIHGEATAVDEFSHAAGEQQVWIAGGRVQWRHGDHAVSIDVTSGVAAPAASATPPRPMLRTATVEGREIRLHDLDANGSMTEPAAPIAVPGIAVLAQAISPVGDVALAIRLDRSLQHDYVAGYAASALLRWVYPLPETARVDPIGLAIALDADRAPAAVVVFHDGDTVTILPALSASENATP